MPTARPAKPGASGPRPPAARPAGAASKPAPGRAGGTRPGLRAGKTTPARDSLLDHAARALQRLLAFDHPADAVLSAYFREFPALGQRDRGFVAEACYAVLRHLRELEGDAGREPRRLLLAALARHLGYSIRRLAGLASAEELAWLAAPRTPGRELPPAVALSVPDWLYERLVEEMGAQEAAALLRALNQSAPLDLRVNLMKSRRDDALRALRASGVDVDACRLAPDGVRLEGKPALHQHPLYLSGEVEVQDEGSQLLCHLVAPRRGEMVVDFCAGAGGKTLALGALMRSTGRLYAFDVSQPRLQRLGKRLKRSGLSNVHPVLINDEHDQRIKRLAGKVDRVLVDAPCSGLGTLRRNPDLKWRQGPQAVTEMAARQASILASAARLVKPGGRLVYATCSILREENEAVVEAFLAANGEFRLLPAQAELHRQHIELPCGDWFRTLPQRDGTDGFFAAVLERRSG